MVFFFWAVYIDYEYPVQLLVEDEITSDNKCVAFWNDTSFFGTNNNIAPVKFKDAWKWLHPNENGFTFVAPDQVPCRTDRIYASDALLIEDCWLDDGFSVPNKQKTTEIANKQKPTEMANKKLETVKLTRKPTTNPKTTTHNLGLFFVASLAVLAVTLGLIAFFWYRHTRSRLSSRGVMFFLLMVLMFVIWSISIIWGVYFVRLPDDVDKQVNNLRQPMQYEKATEQIFLISDHIPLFASFSLQK